MPNGNLKNFTRLLITLDGFRSHFGRWPSRVRMPRGCIDEIRQVVSPEDFAKINNKVLLVANEHDRLEIVAEDDIGSSLDYGTALTHGESVTHGGERLPAGVWLGVHPIVGDL
jgi:hypothetical protein